MAKPKLDVQMSAIEYPFIDGFRSRINGDGFFPAIDPATERVLTQVVQSGDQHIQDAVESATTAQRRWMALSSDARAQALWRWGELILQSAEELATLDTLDIGRPIRDTSTDPMTAARAARYWAGMTEQIRGEQLPTANGHLTYTVREPIGVVAIILPWNGPMVSMLNRVAPALACGNGVVLKPSEGSSISAGRLAEIAIEAGIPPGLLNVLTGDGRVGSALVEHPGVHAISFTGSVAVGREIARAAAGTFKSVTLEMGGKSPTIVFADADLTEAVQASTWGVFANSGQVCCASTRLLVQRSVSTAVSEAIADQAARLRVGDPLDMATQLGPVVSRRHRELVDHYVRNAVDAGARLVGAPSARVLPGQGYYVEPVVLTGLEGNSPAAREEIFGPVLTVVEFDDEDEALALANDTRYGLAANIWTADGSRMLRMAEGIVAGTIWGNSSRVMDPSLPFGGFKDSGLGNAYADGAITGSTRLKRVSIRYRENAPLPSWTLT
jgi:acyl-CoA reductase-like NAD-dependent aldehyde dehydrogenase